MAFLTVAIPTIGRDTLARAVKSVIRQTVPCNLVVESDPRGEGCGPTLNRALERVASTWLATLGDDDTLHPGFAALLSRQDQTADLIVFQMRYPDGFTLPAVTRPEDLRFRQVGCSYAVKTAVARRIGFIDAPCTAELAEDWEMIRGVRDSGGDVRIVPEVAYRVRH